MGLLNLHGCILNAESLSTGIDEALDWEELWEVVAITIPPRSAMLVRLVFIESLSHEQAAAATGMSRRRVSEIISESLRLLRPHLESFRTSSSRRTGHRCPSIRDIALMRYGQN